VPDSGAFGVSLSAVGYRIEPQREPGSTADRDIADGGVQLAVRWRGRATVFGRFAATISSSDAPTFVSTRDGLAGLQIELPAPAPWMRTGLVAAATLPWGEEGRGFSQGSADPSVALLVTVPLGQSDAAKAFLHLNAGRTWRRGETGHGYEGEPLYYLEPIHPASDGDGWDLRAAFEVSSTRIAVFAEVILDALEDERVSWREGPLFVTPGFRMALGSTSLLLATKVSLATDDGATTAFRPPREIFPEWQLGFALAWPGEGGS
jgi:hypothetical protein